jgi:short-subunit dehydrogenase
MKKNMKLVQVQDEPNWARDENSGAILNINKEEIRIARERKKLRMQKQKEETNLKAKVDKLENDISDIKSLLSQLAERL